MNTTTDHLAKAKEYIAKGEGYYRKAADEIIAAKQADSTLSNRAIGERIGKSRDWVRLLVQARTNGDEVAPFAKRPTDDSGAAKRVARERPEELADAIESAPPEARRRAVEAISNAAADDPETRASIAGAGARASRAMQEDAEQRERKRSPDLVNRSEAYNIASDLLSARYKVTRALERLGEIELTDETRFIVTEQAKTLENAISWLLSFLETGDRSWQEQLEKLLADE